MAGVSPGLWRIQEFDRAFCLYLFRSSRSDRDRYDSVLVQQYIRAKIMMRVFSVVFPFMNTE